MPYPLTVLRSIKYIVFTRNHTEVLYLGIIMDSKNMQIHMVMADNTSDLVVSSDVNVLEGVA